MAWTTGDIAIRVHDKHAGLIRQTIEQAFPAIRLLDGPPAIGSALNIFIGFRPPEGETLDQYDWIHSTGAGVDHLVTAIDAGRFCPAVTRTIGRMGEQIGEFCLGYALAHFQRMAQRRALQQVAEWNPAAASPAFCFESEIAILGTGQIGRGIARAFKGLGAHVTGYSRRGSAQDGFDEVYPVADFGRGRPTDVLVLALPSTGETANLVGRDMLCGLPGVLLINVGRGATLDADALQAALGNGAVAHAVLDVFETEPLPGTDWRWQDERITIAPHVSGQTRPEDAVEGFCQMLSEFLESGKKPASVDIVRGY